MVNACHFLVLLFTFLKNMSSANNKVFKDLPVTLTKCLETWIMVSLFTSKLKT